MTEGTVIFTFCETCSEETPHRVLKGRMGPTPESGFDGTVQCIECRSVHNAQFPMEKPRKVRAVVSHGENSETTWIEFSPLEEVRVNEELYFGEHNLKITSMEAGGRRVRKAKAKDIDTLWMKVFDTVWVKVSIVRGESTKSEKVEAPPDEEFAVGDILEFGRDKVVIDKIKTERSMVYREGNPVEAREIKRIYSKIVKERRG
ncbi:MAG: HVO_0476 family zinc finger protein [Thermoplasmatota archaeon]